MLGVEPTLSGIAKRSGDRDVERKRTRPDLSSYFHAAYVTNEETGQGRRRVFRCSIARCEEAELKPALPQACGVHKLGSACKSSGSGD